MIRTYNELNKLETYKDRLEYLSLTGRVGEETFGWDRYLNQMLYRNPEWKQIRKNIILRDEGFDMGLEDYPIIGRIIVHHMNPITIEDLKSHNPIVFDPRYLITVSHKTHNKIHYGSFDEIEDIYVERKPNDTNLW